MKNNFSEIKTGLVSRVEGHAEIYVKFSTKGIENVNVKVLESARFFEAMLLGKHFKDVPILASRICGICNHSHTQAAIEAIEAILEFKPNEDIMLLREALNNISIIYNHILHLYFLVLPDYYGYDDILEMSPKHMGVVKRGMKFAETIGYINSIIAGRTIHGLTNVIGGFTKAPSEDKIRLIIEKLKSIKEDAKITLENFINLQQPFKAVREGSIYAATYKDGSYPFIYTNGVATSNGEKISKDEFSRNYKEEVRTYSKAKIGNLNGKVITVGAIARYNIANQNLHPEAINIIKNIGIKEKFLDKFQNNIAQAIEVIHCIERTIEILENINLKNIKKENLFPKAGSAVAIIEAPRGILMHQYELDEYGRVKFANIVTPTSINIASIELDIKSIFPNLSKDPNFVITSNIEKLLRAYDPCFSCSAHNLKIKIDK
ncbi:MAG: Ni/Fe hydrogenase subunit alpha [Nitrososphaerota archaeon]